MTPRVLARRATPSSSPPARATSCPGRRSKRRSTRASDWQRRRRRRRRSNARSGTRTADSNPRANDATTADSSASPRAPRLATGGAGARRRRFDDEGRRGGLLGGVPSTRRATETRTPSRHHSAETSRRRRGGDATSGTKAETRVDRRTKRIGLSRRHRVVDDADRVVDALDAFGSSRVSNPSNAHLDENAKRATFAVSREEAIAAVRACATPRECASTLAEGPVRAALAPRAGVAVGGDAAARASSPGTRPRGIGRANPRGSSCAFGARGSSPRCPPRMLEINARDGRARGYARVRFRRTSRRRAGRSPRRFATRGRVAAEKSAAPRDPRRDGWRGRDARSLDEKHPGVSAQSESADAFDAGSGDAAFDDDAFDDAAACAAASARVMLASSRTVRGGDALRLVLSLFPGADPNDRDGDGVDDVSPAAEAPEPAPETTSDFSRHPRGSSAPWIRRRRNASFVPRDRRRLCRCGPRARR